MTRVHPIQHFLLSVILFTTFAILSATTLSAELTDNSNATSAEIANTAKIASYREEKLLPPGFIVKLTIALLILLTLSVVLLKTYHKTINKLFSRKTQKPLLRDKGELQIRSIRLSSKTQLHIVEDVNNTIVVTESSLNVTTTITTHQANTHQTTASDSQCNSTPVTANEVQSEH